MTIEITIFGLIIINAMFTIIGFGIGSYLVYYIKRIPTKQDIDIGAWLSAALSDPKVCAQFKKDIQEWFNSFEDL